MEKESKKEKVDKYNDFFPKFLREQLIEHNVTQEELAKYVGVTRQAIAQYKDGITTPELYNFEKIVKFFREEKRSKFFLRTMARWNKN